IEVCELICNEHGAYPRAIRSDRGGEYIHKSFHDYCLKRISSRNQLLRTRLSPMVRLRGSTLLLRTWYELHSWVIFPNLCGLKPFTGHATYRISCLQVLSKGRLHLKCSTTPNHPSATSSRSIRLF